MVKKTLKYVYYLCVVLALFYMGDLTESNNTIILFGLLALISLPLIFIGAISIIGFFFGEMFPLDKWLNNRPKN